MSDGVCLEKVLKVVASDWKAFWRKDVASVDKRSFMNRVREFTARTHVCVNNEK